MRVDEIARFTTGLSVTPPATVGLFTPLLLVDTEDVPLDLRYRITALSSYQEEFTASGETDLWCDALWGQGRYPSQAYIGRWAKAATAPYFVCGSPTAWSTLGWKAVTAGDLAVTNGTSTEQFTTGTMASTTSLADVCAVIQTELRTATTLATELATCTVSIDILGRIKIKSSVTGSTAKSISVVAPTGGSGTDITTSSYLNIASGAFAVAGIDAEDPDDALAAIYAKPVSDRFCVNVRSTPSIAQTVALATALQIYGCIGEFRITDPDAKNASATTDVPYLLEAGANKNCHCIYIEHTAQHPDAAITAQLCTRSEGAASPAFLGLTGCYESGLDTDGTTIKPLTAGEIAALDAKGCDYLVKPVNVVHCAKGLTPGGVEIRHRIGLYWLDQRSSESAYAKLLAMAEANQVMTFSDADIQSLGGIYSGYCDELVKRKCIDSGYTMVLPSAADFDATVKATHILTLADMASLMGQFAVTSIVATSTATV
jgi:hypothetical protein